MNSTVTDGPSGPPAVTALTRGQEGGKPERMAEQVDDGLFSRRLDAAELRVWVADEMELGERVAAEFVSAGRCLAGTLDQRFFDAQLRRFPNPEDAPKRRQGLGTARLCEDHAHDLRLGDTGALDSAHDRIQVLGRAFAPQAWPSSRSRAAGRGWPSER